MRSNGGTMRNAGSLCGDEAIAAGKQIEHNAQLLKLLFPEGSNNGDSKALDLIWSDWDNFIAILDKLEADGAAMATAGEAGDAEAYLAAVQAAGSNCGTCHGTYRGQ
jgi:cytochrome c556